jgi:hypothetical protein
MMSSTFALLLALGFSSENPDSVRADSAFRARSWALTAQLYERITRTSPSQGMAWLRLGMAKQALNETDDAITAFERALSLQFSVAAANFRLARLHAQKGNADRAFTHLDALVPLRAAPVAVLDTLSELASLRSDPRYRALTDRITAARFPCRALPEAHQLDFWIGDWDVTPWQAPPASNPAVIGTNRIEPILEHCVVMENWVGGGPSPSAGKSMNFWDTNRRKWRQIWMGDGGGSLDYAGEFTNGAMRFEGWTLAPSGSRVLQKLTFFPISKDTVRQLFETSSDSGKSWQPGFDGRYVRRKPASP